MRSRDEDAWQRAMRSRNPWRITGAFLGVATAVVILLASVPWFAASLFAARILRDIDLATRIVDRSPAGRFAKWER